MPANLSPHTCLSCGVASGRNHIDGCPAEPMNPASVNGALLGLATLSANWKGFITSICFPDPDLPLIFGGPAGGNMKCCAVGVTVERPASLSITNTLRKVRDLAPSTRNRFWSELRSLVEAEWECPPGYDRTAWAMEHATAGMVEAAYQRVEG